MKERRVDSERKTERVNGVVYTRTPYTGDAVHSELAPHDIQHRLQNNPLPMYFVLRKEGGIEKKSA